MGPEAMITEKLCGVRQQLRHHLGSFSRGFFSTTRVCHERCMKSSAHAYRSLLGACNPMACPPPHAPAHCGKVAVQPMRRSTRTSPSYIMLSPMCSSAICRSGRPKARWRSQPFVRQLRHDLLAISRGFLSPMLPLHALRDVPYFVPNSSVHAF